MNRINISIKILTKVIKQRELIGKKLSTALIPLSQNNICIVINYDVFQFKPVLTI